MNLYVRCLIQNIFTCDFVKSYDISGRGVRILASNKCYMSNELRAIINSKLDARGSDRMHKDITQVGCDLWTKDFHVNWPGGGTTVEEAL